MNLAGRIGVAVFVVSVAVTPRSSPAVVGWTGGEAGEVSPVEGCPAAPETTSAGPRAVAATPPVFSQAKCMQRYVVYKSNLLLVATS